MPCVAVATAEDMTADFDESEPFDSERVCVLMGNMLIFRNIMGGGKSLSLIHISEPTRP